MAINPKQDFVLLGIQQAILMIADLDLTVDEVLAERIQDAYTEMCDLRDALKIQITGNTR